MSLFDSLDNLKYQLNRFLWPVLFLVAGIILLKMALVPKVEMLNNDEPLSISQNSLFLYSALIFVVGSVIWFLFLFGLINRMIGYVVMGIMAIGSCVLLYQDYMTVKRDVDYNAQFKRTKLNIWARMGDIKSAEVAYKDFNGVYTDNFDVLIDFIKTGSKKSLVSKGTLPERRITPEERDYIYKDDRPIDKLMTEEEAQALSKRDGGKILNENGEWIEFARDTVLKPVLETVFESDRYIETRSKIADDLIPFHPDSIRHVPFSNLLATLDTGSVMKGEIKVPTLLITMQHPMDSTLIYTIGDTQDNHLRDNWTK